jgi:hypothetical protein
MFLSCTLYLLGVVRENWKLQFEVEKERLAVTWFELSNHSYACN